MRPRAFYTIRRIAKSNEWLWQRVLKSEASTILALGTVAEHGILRLFARNLQDVLISDSGDSTIIFSNTADHRWPARYAHTRRKLTDRKAMPSPPFWKVTGRTETGLHRKWNVAVTPHPTGARGIMVRILLKRCVRPTVSGNALYSRRGSFLAFRSLMKVAVIKPIAIFVVLCSALTLQPRKNKMVRNLIAGEA